jgi:hypothetical protein
VILLIIQTRESSLLARISAYFRILPSKFEGCFAMNSLLNFVMYRLFLVADQLRFLEQ